MQVSYQLTENQSDPRKWGEVAPENAYHVGIYSLSAIPNKIPEHDSKIRRRGDFWIDVDRKPTKENGLTLAKAIALAISDVREIKRYLASIEVNLKQIELFASGGKGFHLKIPLECMGGIAANDLPLIHKRIAEKIASLTNAEIDLSLYKMGMGQTIRRPNKLRHDGKFKVQITWAEFDEIDPESYTKITSSPRNLFSAEPPTENQSLINLYSAAMKEQFRANTVKNESPEVSPEIIELLKGNQPPCVGKIASGAFGGDRKSNDIAQTVGRMINVFNTPNEIIEQICENNATNETSTSDFVTRINSAKSCYEGDSWSCGYVRVLDGFNTSEICKNCALAEALHKSLMPTEEECDDFCFRVYEKWTGKLSAGVYWHGKDKEPVLLCDVIRLIAATSDEHGNECGKLLEFFVREQNRFKRWDMPAELIGDPKTLLAELRKRGFWAANLKGLQDKIISFLNDRRTSSQQFTKVNKVGWHRDSFVLPNKTIGDQSLIFSSQLSEFSLYGESGTLQEWQKHVSRLAQKNPILLFSISTAFTGALQKMAGLSGGGGFHLYGPSSVGKSTSLFTLSSVFGNHTNYVMSWKATGNGIEARAEQYNDSVMPMDEISQGKPKDIEEALYMLANGRGKVRADQKGNARKAREWQLLAMSNGEFSIEDCLKEAGLSPKAGQELRLANLPIFGKYGAFDYLHEFPSGKEFVEHIDHATKKFYGVAGAEWIQKLVELKPNAKELVKLKESELLETLNCKLNDQQLRVLRRFALVAAAGELATDWNITGWREGEATDGVLACIKQWLTVRGGASSIEGKKAVESLRQFIELHGNSRFKNITKGLEKIEETRIIHQQAGYLEHISKFFKDGQEIEDITPLAINNSTHIPNTIYYFNQATLRQVLGSFEQDLKLLKESGILKCKGEKHSISKWIDGETKRVYVIDGLELAKFS